VRLLSLIKDRSDNL